MDNERKCWETPYMTRRIGNTVYQVRIFFGSGGETMADKIIRLIQNGGLENREKSGIVELPQMSRRSERSAS